jgi:hypothetical protein
VTPRDHLEQVVKPNLQEFSDNYGDIRRAFNAIASVDALAAHIYWWAVQHAPAHVTQFADDSAYRQYLATLNDSYKLAFEVAKASKHVVLTRGAPAVTRSGQVSVKSVGFGQGRWGDMRWNGPPQVFISPTGQDPWGVEGVLTRSLEFLEAQMLALGVP